MSVEITGNVGPQTLSDGTVAPPYLGRKGEVVVTELHGQLYETSARGNVFIASTAVTGVAPGTALSTTAGFALSNPAGTTKNLSVLGIWVGYLSGTPPVGFLALAVNTNAVAAAVTGTAIAPIAGSPLQPAGVGKAFTTATLPATPTLLRPLTALLAASPFIGKDYEDVRGSIVIPPGCTLSIEGVGAGGTSPLFVYSVMWEEVSI
jgi:hypothetical protein